MSRSGLLLALTVVLTFACRPKDATVDQPMPEVSNARRPAVITPAGARIAVELATDPETRQQGLMYRESLPPNSGMLFLFRTSGVNPFWMLNTRIPLDMIWLDEGRRIIHIESAVPPCTGNPCPNYAPEVASRYVLELAAREAARYGLKPGDVLTFENIEGINVR